MCIKGGLFDFFDKLKDLSLRDLDADKYLAKTGVNLKLTPWTVARVANTNEDDVVVFPLIDWDTANNANLTFSQPGLPDNEAGEEGNDESLRIHIKSQYIFPAVKLSALVEAICLEQGYTFELPAEVTNDPDQKYKQSVLPVCSLNPGEKKLNEIKGEAWIDSSYWLAEGTINRFYRKGKFFYFRSFIRNGIMPKDNNENDPCYHYNPSCSGTHTFKLLATPAVYNSAMLLNIQYDVFTVKGKKVVTRGANIPLNGQPLLITEEIEVGGYFRFWIQTDSFWLPAELKAFFFTCEHFKPIGAIFPNESFPLLQNMPDISQLELIKAVCQLYGLMVSVDESRKRIKAYTFNDVVAAIANNEYEDWSHKLDDTNHSSTYQWSSYGQRSYITYAEEEGKDGEKLQDRAFFTIDNHTLPAEKTLFELPFATCEETIVCGHTMAKIRMVEGGDSSPDSITEPKPKLLYVEKKDGVKVKFLYIPNPSMDEEKHTVLLTNFSSLSTSLFVKNYYAILAERFLPRTRVLKEKLWLTSVDIQKFTHQKPVYLSKYNCCFYVNKVNNYQPSKLTEVELVAILSAL